MVTTRDSETVEAFHRVGQASCLPVPTQSARRTNASAEALAGQAGSLPYFAHGSKSRCTIRESWRLLVNRSAEHCSASWTGIAVRNNAPRSIQDARRSLFEEFLRRTKGVRAVQKRKR